jgi:hypothetical protein
MFMWRKSFKYRKEETRILIKLQARKLCICLREGYAMVLLTVNHEPLKSRKFGSHRIKSGWIPNLILRSAYRQAESCSNELDSCPAERSSLLE